MSSNPSENRNAEFHFLNLVPGLGGKGRHFLTRSTGVSILAVFAGVLSGITVRWMAAHVKVDYRFWEMVTERGGTPYFIVVCFVYGLVYLGLGYLFACFPRLAPSGGPDSLHDWGSF